MKPPLTRGLIHEHLRGVDVDVKSSPEFVKRVEQDFERIFGPAETMKEPIHGTPDEA